MSKRGAGLLLLAILGIAAVLRIWGMDYGLPYPTSRPDEERIVGRAYHILATGDFHPGTHTYPGLMIYLETAALALYAWAGQLFGLYDKTFDFLFAAVVTDPGLQYRICRSVSIFAAIGSVFLTYVYARRGYASREAGLLAAAILATAYVHVRDSRFATVDAGMTFFVCLTLVLSLRAAERQRARDFVLAGIAGGLATAAKYNAGVVCLTILAAALLKSTNGDRAVSIRRRLVDKDFYVNLTAAAAVMVAVFFLTSPYTFLNWSTTAYELSEIRRVLYEGSGERAIWVHLRETFPVGLGWPVFIASIVGLGRALIQTKHADIIMLAFLVPSLWSASTVRWVFPRYLVPLAPWFAVLAAVVLSSMLARLPRGRALATAIACLLLCGPGVYRSVAFDRVAARKDTRVLASEWVEQRLPPRSKIAVCRGYGAPLLNTDRRRPPVFEPVPIACTPEAIQRDHGASYLITHEHPMLEHFSPDITELRAVLEGNDGEPLGTQIALIRPFRLPYIERRVREQTYFYSGDAFYLPFSGLSLMDRGGPIIRIWKLE